MMKKVIIFILCVLLCVSCSLPALASSDAETAETEEVPTDEEPTDTEEYEDYSESFLNANIYTFAVGVAALLVCTSIFVIIKLRKKSAEK